MTKYLATLMLTLSSLLGCHGQSGNYIVENRASATWENAGGGCEMLYGTATSDANDQRLLLALIAVTPNKGLTEKNVTGGDGIEVSAINVDFHDGGPSKFGYGSIWNRTDDIVAIDSEEFERQKGNVFIIVPGISDNLRIQIPGICNGGNVAEILEHARRELNNPAPELAILANLSS